MLAAVLAVAPSAAAHTATVPPGDDADLTALLLTAADLPPGWSPFAVGAPPTADAFCGFYVAGADTKLYNNATMVVMMRDGTRTVLAMQNNYQGPPENFAMVVPVPVVLGEDDVKTLEATVEEVGHTMHAHPTMSEAVMEAALDAMGQAIHL